MSIFARLFLLIGLVSGVSLSIVAGLLWRNSVSLERQLTTENKQAGQRVLLSGRRLLVENLQSTHRIIVREKALKVESYFVNIASTLRLESTLIQQFLTDRGTLKQAPPLFEGNELVRRRIANPDLKRTLIKVQPYAMFHVAPGVSTSRVSASMNRLRRLGGFFMHTQQALAGCDSSYFGSEHGFILGYPGGDHPFKLSYDPRLRPWYKRAMEQNKLIWSVDSDRSTGGLLLTCAQPVALSSGARPVGVAAIDLRPGDVMRELFDVGSPKSSTTIKFSRAILVDETHHVRVSASRDPRTGKLQFDHSALKLPLVSTLPGFAEAEALARANANPDEDSGIFFSGQDMAQADRVADSVFIYSNISFSSPGELATPDQNWHYIVKVPLAPLLKPITSVSGQIQHSTQDISRAIQSRTQESAALVLALITATLLAALTVAYFAARGGARPLIQMAHVARGVGEGDLKQQAVETGGGEIGELGRAINAMIRGLRQRDFLKVTFGRYTAPSVVDKLLLEGNVYLGGSRSTATVFFSDLAGFTTLAEGLEPEVLVSLLNEYFDAMTGIILGSEGTLDKYIGDAILAFWGEPVPHQDDAARACRAALEQFETLDKLCQKWESEGRPRLGMRIGIETGEVIVGNVGSDLKLNYTVLGDTVNFASRLEAVNKLYGTRILIGETTRARAGAAIEAREVDLLAVAGKRKPVRVYELLGMAGAVAPARLEGCKLYEQALDAFRARLWAQAQASILRAQELLAPEPGGADKSCAMLLGRIQVCRESEPPEGWDGALVLDHK